MIAWIGVVAALLFFVLWGGGVLQDLARRPTGDPSADPAVQQLPPSQALPEEKRLQVFEEFIRSLPDDEGNVPPAAAS